MVSIVIPAYNEESAIADTVAHVRAIMDQAGETGTEIIVVDDGSSDRTPELAEAAGAKVLRKVQNVGYGHSLKMGIAAANNDCIVITDADGTYPIENIPELLALYRQGWDMVVGARTGQHYRESALKHPLRIILKGLVEFTAGQHIPDVNSGLRVFSRRTIMPLFPHLSDVFSFTTSSTLAYLLQRRAVKFVPITYHKRIGATKVRLFRDALRTLQYIVQAILFYNPLKIYLLLSLGTGMLSLLGLAVGVLIGSSAGLWLFVAGLMTSVLVFALGLLAEMVRQFNISSTD